MTDHCELKIGGGLGAVPRGPQKSAVAVSGRRPAVKAPFVPGATVLATDENGDDPEVVRDRHRRSWGILVRRSLEQGHSAEGRRS
jgi:hypothetical protein